MASPVAILDILLTANTGPANAALMKTQGQLKATSATAASTGKVMKTALLGVGVAALGAGAAMYKIGEEFDSAYDKIKAQTGATGKEFEKLKKVTRGVFASTPSDLDTVSEAVSGLNQRLDLTGKPLRALTRQMVQLSEVTGEDVGNNVRVVTRLFGDWSIKTDKQTGTLDKLFRLSQSTGTNLADLADQMVQFGSPLRQLGFSFDEAAVMFAKFEKEGVNVQTALPGLRFALKSLSVPSDELSKALKTLNIDTSDANTALTEFFDAIKDGKVDAELASQVFGGRAWADMKAAIEEGRFEFGELIKDMNSGKGTIDKAERSTRDFAEQWQIFVNDMKTTLEPAASDFFAGIGELMKEVRKTFKREGLDGVIDLLVQKLSDATPKLVEAAKDIGVKLGGGILKGIANVPMGTQAVLAGGVLAWFGGKAAAEKAGTKFGKSFGKGLLLALPLMVPAAFKIGQEFGTKFKEGFDSFFDSLTGDKSVNALDHALDGIDKLRDGAAAIAKIKMPWDEKVNKLAEQFGVNTNKAAKALDSATHAANKADTGYGKLNKGLDKVYKGSRALTQGVDRDSKSQARSFDSVQNKGSDFSEKTKNALKTVAKAVQSLDKGTSTGLGNIGDNLNSLLKGTKTGSVSFGIKKAGNIVQGFQPGGIASGYSRVDDRLIAIRGGEAVLRPEDHVPTVDASLRMTHGIGLRDYLRKTGGKVGGGGGFASGGIAGLQPGIARLAQYANERLGLQVSSGLRPGDTDSFHGRGEAVDLVPPGMSATKSLFNAFKSQLAELFYDPWGGYDNGQMIGAIGGHMDHIHAAISGQGGPASVGSSRVAKWLLTGPGGPLKRGGQGALDKARSAANAFLRQQMNHGPLPTGSGALSAGEFLGLAKRAIGITNRSSIWGDASGFSPQGLLTLAMQESSLVPSSINNWDINAQAGNPSGGLMHLTQSNMRAYAEPSLGSNMFDPLASIAASINYQIDRYGHQVTHSPYALGGIVPGFAGGGITGSFKSSMPAFSFEDRTGKLRRMEPWKSATKIAQTMQAIGRQDERIDIADQIANADGIFSESERLQAITLHGDLMQKLLTVRDTSAAGLARSNKMLARKGTPNWQKQQLRKLSTGFSESLVEMQGLTGKGGRIFDTMLTLGGLGKSVAPPPGSSTVQGLTFSQLLDIAKATNYGVFNSMPVMHQGGVVPGPVGANVPIMAQAGERVTPVGGGPDIHIYIEGRALDESVDYRIERHDNHINLADRAGVTR